MISAVLALALFTQLPKDAQMTDLGDGYSRLKTAAYSVDVPNGWEVTAETPWGQRKVQPTGQGGELGMMTAPPSQQSWDQLYRISLSFILREEDGKPTPVRLTKSKAGLEIASFEVLDANAFPSRRYVLIRDAAKGLLALSVKVPNPEADAQWTKHFKRLVASAKIAD